MNINILYKHAHLVVYLQTSLFSPSGPERARVLAQSSYGCVEPSSTFLLPSSFFFVAALTVKPTMLLELATRSRKHDRLQPCRCARTVPIVSVRRNVRIYPVDPRQEC
jgi:hypothetical protein